jgi:arylsulfatase A-like enzyme
MKLNPFFLFLGIPFLVQARPEKPNVVYLMSDELAYYELAHMGNPLIKTPVIDQFAKKGIRFTHALAGSPVCGPLRCNLMTGKHAGHSSVRANDGGTPLRAEEETIASLLKEEGYATGGFGKWGCGGRDSTGVPEKHGFDVFFGYYDQVHAHSFYPPYLIRNSEEVHLPGNDGGRSGGTYAQYPIMNEALRFIEENKDNPFFCYLPFTPPHGMYDVPEDEPAWKLYENEKWMSDPSVPQDAKNYAVMVSMIDRQLGQVLALLKKLNLEENTIVFFTGDNGGQDRFRSKDRPRGFFGPNVDPKTKIEFRGGKGSLYEGGLRIPFLVRWPGQIKAGQVSDLVFYQPDVLPTLTELCGAETPEEVDGLSVLPTLLGEKNAGRKQKTHKMLYWEYGNQVAVRHGSWKAIKAGKTAPWALYDLSKDPSETTDLSSSEPKQLANMVAFAQKEHQPVRPGTFLDPTRARHNRDRQAKFGFSGVSSIASQNSFHRLDHPDLLPNNQIRLFSVSSQNIGNDKRARYVIDGKPETIWHTQFSPNLEKHPHELVLDLKKARPVRGVQYLTRQDNGWNGTFAKTEFFLSQDKEVFPEKPFARTFAKQKKAQTFRFPKTISARFIKVRILSEANGKEWASAAEIGILIDPSVPGN